MIRLHEGDASLKDTQETRSESDKEFDNHSFDDCGVEQEDQQPLPREDPPVIAFFEEEEETEEEEDEAQYREDLFALRLAGWALAYPCLLVAAAVCLGALLALPSVCVQAMATRASRRSGQRRWNQLLELLTNDDTPSPKVIFFMNALLVAVILVPCAKPEIRAAAKVSIARLPVQLHRRLLAKPVAQRKPAQDDVCAICLGALDDDGGNDDQDPKENKLTNTTKDGLKYCRFGCGKPVHADCIATWLKQKHECAFCGTLWADDDNNSLFYNN